MFVILTCSFKITMSTKVLLEEQLLENSQFGLTWLSYTIQMLYINVTSFINLCHWHYDLTTIEWGRINNLTPGKS